MSAMFRKLLFKGDVTREDSQRRFLAQHSIAMLEQCCVLFEIMSRQYCNTFLRKKSSLQIVLCNITLSMQFSQEFCSRL